MIRNRFISSFSVLLVALVALLFAPATASAHCDGMDGPVVKAAQRALRSGNVNLALLWVQKSEEAEVRETFKKAMSVRRLSPQARELARRKSCTRRPSSRAST